VKAANDRRKIEFFLRKQPLLSPQTTIGRGELIFEDLRNLPAYDDEHETKE
jgi:hypothetical protein